MVLQTPKAKASSTKKPVANTTEQTVPITPAPTPEVVDDEEEAPKAPEPTPDTEPEPEPEEVGELTDIGESVSPEEFVPDTEEEEQAEEEKEDSAEEQTPPTPTPAPKAPATAPNKPQNSASKASGKKVQGHPSTLDIRENLTNNEYLAVVKAVNYKEEKVSFFIKDRYTGKGMYKDTRVARAGINILKIQAGQIITVVAMNRGYMINEITDKTLKLNELMGGLDTLHVLTEATLAAAYADMIATADEKELKDKTTAEVVTMIADALNVDIVGQSSLTYDFAVVRTRS